MASGTLRSGEARRTDSTWRYGAGHGPGFRLYFDSCIFDCARFGSAFLCASCDCECAVYCDKVANRTYSRVRL